MPSKKIAKKSSNTQTSLSHKNGISVRMSLETKNLVRVVKKASQAIEQEAKQKGLTRIIGKKDGIYESRPDGTTVRIKKVNLKTFKHAPQKFKL